MPSLQYGSASLTVTSGDVANVQAALAALAGKPITAASQVVQTVTLASGTIIAISAGVPIAVTP
jgi:hypothetical protein